MLCHAFSLALELYCFHEASNYFQQKVCQGQGNILSQPVAHRVTLISDLLAFSHTLIKLAGP